MGKISIQIIDEKTFDLVVIGGGLAGATSAISVGRKGLKVALIEQSGILGGQATQGIVTPLDARQDMKNKPFGGIMSEISNELIELSKKYSSGGDLSGTWPIASPHVLKYLLLKKCIESNVKVLFHTSLLSCENKNNKISCIYVLNKSGVEKINAKVFIDASGDGDLIYKSGADFTIGSENNCFDELKDSGLDKIHETGESVKDYSDKKIMQPVSIFFTLGGVDVDKVMQYNNKNFVYGDFGITKEQFEKWEFYNTCGFEPNGDKIPLPQGRILVTRSARKDVAVINMSRVIGIDGSNADSLNEGEIKAQIQVIAIVDFLKTFIDGFENCYLVESGNTLGVRESRRLKGKVVFSGLDAIFAKKLQYPIARGSYIIDIHDPTGRGKAIGGEIRGDYYDIPYGSLITEKVQNLLVCGRCISADHIAHSSTRIQGTCMLTGQAAGTASYLAIKNNIEPSELKDKLVNEELIKDGVWLN